MKPSGLFAGDTVNRLDSGVGQILRKTIQLGESVIAVGNIGSLRIMDGENNHGITVVGGFIVLVGIGLLALSKILGAIIIVSGIGLIIWNLSQDIDIYLLIGTCDGRTAIIVSKDKTFLGDVRDFIRDKINTGSDSGAIINISNSRLEGTIAIGDRASAKSEI